jgi:APA family basic amino acid/polyamine antiporter
MTNQFPPRGEQAVVEKQTDAGLPNDYEPSAGGGPTLARRLGMVDLTLLVMGSVIGTGIFVVPREVARLVQSPSLVLTAWFLGGLVALAGSLVYAEWARRRPHVGGQYAFLREAYHPSLAFVYGWSLLWVIQSGGMAAVAVVFANYLLELLRHGAALVYAPLATLATGPSATSVVTTVAIGGLAVVNCTGVRAAATTQNIFMILKILAILLVILGGLLIATTPQPATAPRAPSLDWSLVTLFGAAMVPVFFAYGGWHTTTFVAEEINDPGRTLPRGLVLGVAGVMVLYLGINLACLRVLGTAKLAASEHPASDVMRAVLGEPGAVLISIGIAISALGFLSQAMLTSPRVYYAMARDGLFFRDVAWVHPRSRVPVIAVLLQGLYAMVIALSGTFDQILRYVMSVEMIFWCLTALGLFLIRRRDAKRTDAARLSMPGHPFTTLLFVAVNLAVLVNLFYRAPLNSVIGVGIAAAGFPVYFTWRTFAGPRRGTAQP